MTADVTKLPKSIRQEAQEEFDNEQRQKAVSRLKVKLKERHTAALALDNIDREIKDLEEQQEQGDIT